MATNTKNFKFKKPDESDFYDVQDQNGNWDMADEELEKLNAPTFEDYSGGALLPEASSAIDGIKSGFSLPTLLSNIKAAFKGACLLGHIVNNCVTNRSDLPLSAAQGKALMDMLTKLNGDSHSLLKIKSTSGTINLGAWKSTDLRVPVTAPEGYTPIGLMSFDTAGAIPICINAMMISTVEVTVGLTNPSADTANNTGFTLSALYIKSTFVC